VVGRKVDVVRRGKVRKNRFDQERRGVRTERLGKGDLQVSARLSRGGKKKSSIRSCKRRSKQERFDFKGGGFRPRSKTM